MTVQQLIAELKSTAEDFKKYNQRMETKLTVEENGKMITTGKIKNVYEYDGELFISITRDV